jgi:hypothetical protein
LIKKGHHVGFLKAVSVSNANFLTALTTAAATVALADLKQLHANLRPLRQFGTMGISARQCDFSIDQNQRQSVRTRPFQKTFDDRVFGKRHWLLGEIKSLNLTSTTLQPIEIGGKRHLLLVNIHSTNARTATQSGIKYLNLGH